MDASVAEVSIQLKFVRVDRPCEINECQRVLSEHHAMPKPRARGNQHFRWETWFSEIGFAEF